MATPFELLVSTATSQLSVGSHRALARIHASRAEDRLWTLIRHGAPNEGSALVRPNLPEEDRIEYDAFADEIFQLCFRQPDAIWHAFEMMGLDELFDDDDDDANGDGDGAAALVPHGEEDEYAQRPQPSRNGRPPASAQQHFAGDADDDDATFRPNEDEDDEEAEGRGHADGDVSTLDASNVDDPADQRSFSMDGGGHDELEDSTTLEARALLLQIGTPPPPSKRTPRTPSAFTFAAAHTNVTPQQASRPSAAAAALANHMPYESPPAARAHTDDGIAALQRADDGHAATRPPKTGHGRPREQQAPAPAAAVATGIVNRLDRAPLGFPPAAAAAAAKSATQPQAAEVDDEVEVEEDDDVGDASVDHLRQRAAQHDRRRQQYDDVAELSSSADDYGQAESFDDPQAHPQHRYAAAAASVGGGGASMTRPKTSKGDPSALAAPASFAFGKPVLGVPPASASSTSTSSSLVLHHGHSAMKPLGGTTSFDLRPKRAAPHQHQLQNQRTMEDEHEQQQQQQQQQRSSAAVEDDSYVDEFADSIDAPVHHGNAEMLTFGTPPGSNFATPDQQQRRVQHAQEDDEDDDHHHQDGEGDNRYDHDDPDYEDEDAASPSAADRDLDPQQQAHAAPRPSASGSTEPREPVSGEQDEDEIEEEMHAVDEEDSSSSATVTAVLTVQPPAPNLDSVIHSRASVDSSSSSSPSASAAAAAAAAASSLLGASSFLPASAPMVVDPFHLSAPSKHLSPRRQRKSGGGIGTGVDSEEPSRSHSPALSGSTTPTPMHHDSATPPTMATGTPPWLERVPSPTRDRARRRAALSGEFTEIIHGVYAPATFAAVAAAPAAAATSSAPGGAGGSAAVDQLDHQQEVNMAEQQSPPKMEQQQPPPPAMKVSPSVQRPDQQVADSLQLFSLESSSSIAILHPHPHQSLVPTPAPAPVSAPVTVSVSAVASPPSLASARPVPIEVASSPPPPAQQQQVFSPPAAGTSPSPSLTSPLSSPSHFSAPPSPLVMRTARPGQLCEICDDLRATLYCPHCKLFLCEAGNCDAEVHNTKKSSAHQRAPVDVLVSPQQQQQPPPTTTEAISASPICSPMAGNKTLATAVVAASLVATATPAASTIAAPAAVASPPPASVSPPPPVTAAAATSSAAAAIPFDVVSPSSTPASSPGQTLRALQIAQRAPQMMATSTGSTSGSSGSPPPPPDQSDHPSQRESGSTSAEPSLFESPSTPTRRSSPMADYSPRTPLSARVARPTNLPHHIRPRRFALKFDPPCIALAYDLIDCTQTCIDHRVHDMEVSRSQLLEAATTHSHEVERIVRKLYLRHRHYLGDEERPIVSAKQVEALVHRLIQQTTQTKTETEPTN